MNEDTVVIVEDIQTLLGKIQGTVDASVLKAKQEAYTEITVELVNLEELSREMTEENAAMFARVFAVISEIRDFIGEYIGKSEVPLERLQELKKDRLTNAEVRTVFLMVRYAEALRALEAHKPQLIRLLRGAKGLPTRPG
jgi:2',3'-cyclic-nucleotide 2'-phosphodiesterase (5'-nucleotidase family)